MNNSKDLYKKKFTRRALFLGACKIGLLAGLVSRMFYLQVTKNHKFIAMAENNRIRTEIIPPLRGRIFDRNGNLLAINDQRYKLDIEKSDSYSGEKNRSVALKIGDILNFSPEQQANLINEISTLDIDEVFTIKENLNWSEIVELELNSYDLEDINIQVDYSRLYPYANLFAHIIGYVGKVSKKEINSSTIKNIYHNLKIGKNGIEKTQDNLLHGTTGLKRTEVNAKGQFIRDISVVKSIPGSDIKLTLDMELQKTVDAALGNNTGVILVSKIENGEILSMVSKPDFDANLFNDGISSYNWNKLIKDEELPLINRAVALTYPPGSGFKTNVAIAALKENFNPNTTFFCPGYHIVGDRTFKCWKKTGHGTINLYQAIAGSCNVYFWNVAKIIGIDNIANIACKMGYGSKLLQGCLPREQPGIIPTPEWKKKNIGSKWNISDTINTAIGQGYVEATPIQILTSALRIATGKEIIPTLIKQKNEIDFPSLNLDRELSILRKGMEMVVNNVNGTAYKNRIIEPELAMAGKTGTSQVISKRHQNDDLSKENIMKKIRNHGIFTAYAPFHEPKYAFCGVIEHGGFPSLAIQIAKIALTEAQLKKL